MRSSSFGVIAESTPDCEVARELIQRLRGPRLKVRLQAANGCSKLEQRLPTWIPQLVHDGCDALIILRDLDRDPFNKALNDEPALRRRLESIAVPPGIRRLVCIPIEEIEAWFWSDSKVIQKVTRGKGKAHPSPHLIMGPKEKLRVFSMEGQGRPRYTINDNKELAKVLDLDLCARRCPSFRQFRDFVLEN